MNRFLSVVLVVFVAAAALADPPPSQDKLDRRDLSRMRPDDRSRLVQRLGVGLEGLGDRGTVLSGKRSDIEHFNGRIIVIEPWSITDARSVRDLQQLGEALNDLDGVVLIALHKQEDPEKVQRLLQRRPVPGFIVIDSDGELTKSLALDAPGANLIIDRFGAIRYAGIDPSAARELVEALLAEEPDEGQAPKTTLKQFTAGLAQAEDIQNEIDQAWRAGDVTLAATKLEELWQASPPAAAAATMAVLTASNTVQRPLAIELIARYGSIDHKLRAINTLNERTDAPEIAILVRSIGNPQVEHPEKVLAPFLDSRDADIRQAALYALADSASPEVIEPFIGNLNNAPIASSGWGENERDRIMNAEFGVAYHLTKLRAENGRAYKQWLDLYRRDPAGAEQISQDSIHDPAGRPRTVQFSSDTFYTYGPFDLAIRAQQPQIQPDERTAGILAEAAQTAQKNAAPVLGVVYPPPIRVYLADDRGFASLAGNSFMGGQSEVNQIILRIGNLGALQQTMTHEYAHILHQAMFDKTPRWLAEGFAQSVSTPFRRWTNDDIRSVGLEDTIREGGISRLLSWQSGASSDSREANNYLLAHVVIDFLRFGPFTAGDTRLHLLFANISRSRSERESLEIAYGLSPAELDQALEDWLNQR